MPLVDFIDWPLLREGVFLCPFFFAYLLVLIVYDSYTFVCLLRYLIYSLIYKKKKKKSCSDNLHHRFGCTFLYLVT